MKRIRAILLLPLMVTLIIFMCTAMTVSAFAEETETIQKQSTLPENIAKGKEIDEEGAKDKADIDAIAEQFTAYLKEEYGADYEFYYNQIIEQWGSIEGYLLALGEKIPDKYRSSWDKVVGWLGEYSVIWAPAFALAIVIIVAVIGKKQANAVVEKIVEGKLSPIVQELNLQSNATLSLIHAEEALLGKSDRFIETVKELEESEKELMGNG